MSTDSIESAPSSAPAPKRTAWRDTLRALAARAMAALRAHIDDVAPEPPVRSRLATVLIVLAQVASLAAVTVAWKHSGALITAAPAPPPVQRETATTRFGLNEAQRRDMFREMATTELAERQRAIIQNTWGGHAWSREDDLGYVLRTKTREVGTRYGLSLTEAYLVFDEGIRQRWPGPDGQPLPATTTPLSLRTE